MLLDILFYSLWNSKRVSVMQTIVSCQTPTPGVLNGYIGPVRVYDLSYCTVDTYSASHCREYCPRIER